MIIKNKKKNTFLYISILTIALAYFASFLSMDGRIIKRGLRDHYFNFYDYVMTFDLGFSSISKIALDRNYGIILDYGLGLVTKMPEVFLKKIQGFPARPPLETIYIDIKLQDYQQLLEDREKAVRYKILHEHRKVKAKIRYNGKLYKAKIRLKGNESQHWRTRYQMSLRVALKGKNYILGFKKFSLHKVQATKMNGLILNVMKHSVMSCIRATEPGECSPWLCCIPMHELSLNEPYQSRCSRNRMSARPRPVNPPSGKPAPAAELGLP